MHGLWWRSCIAEVVTCSLYGLDIHQAELAARLCSLRRGAWFRLGGVQMLASMVWVVVLAVAMDPGTLVFR